MRAADSVFGSFAAAAGSAGAIDCVADGGTILPGMAGAATTTAFGWTGEGAGSGVTTTAGLLFMDIAGAVGTTAAGAVVGAIGATATGCTIAGASAATTTGGIGAGGIGAGGIGAGGMGAGGIEAGATATAATATGGTGTDTCFAWVKYHHPPAAALNSRAVSKTAISTAEEVEFCVYPLPTEWSIFEVSRVKPVRDSQD